MKERISQVTIDVTLSKLISRATQRFNSECDRIRNDYSAGVRDCSNGIYDKFYRYNRCDDGEAYDAGWYDANKTYQVEKVTFI